MIFLNNFWLVLEIPDVIDENIILIILNKNNIFNLSVGQRKKKEVE